MKILFALPYVPSPIRVRPYNFIRALSDRHEIHVLATASDREMADARALRTFCRGVEVVPLHRLASLRSCVAAAMRGEPLQSAVCQSPGLTRRFADVLARERFDVVHIEHLRAAHLGALLPEGMPKLFDSVDCISLLLERTLRASHCRRQRALALIELHRTRTYEKSLMGRFDQVAVTSPEDARELRELAPAAEIAVVPNGVDLERFSPIAGSREPATLVFSGKMSYHANVTAVLHFVREIFPRIRRVRPDVRIRIVGSNPPPAIQALGQDLAITVTGHVSDMRTAIGDATVAICPVTVKVGIQNKILEAMALGLPVVSSKEGAEGLQARPGQDFLVGEGPVEFGEQVCRLLADSGLASRVSWAGREYVKTHHRWDTAANHLEALYREAIDRRSGTVTKHRVRH